MAREITISDLKSKVDEGWKKQALAEHYGLPVAQMTRLLQEAGLKIRKFHAPLYVLVNDTVTTTVAETTEETVVETQGIIAEEDVNDIPVVGSEQIEAVVEETTTDQTTW